MRDSAVAERGVGYSLQPKSALTNKLSVDNLY
jgi:hypothetical protein